MALAKREEPVTYIPDLYVLESSKGIAKIGISKNPHQRIKYLPCPLGGDVEVKMIRKVSGAKYREGAALWKMREKIFGFDFGETEWVWGTGDYIISVVDSLTDEEVDEHGNFNPYIWANKVHDKCVPFGVSIKKSLKDRFDQVAESIGRHRPDMATEALTAYLSCDPVDVKAISSNFGEFGDTVAVLVKEEADRIRSEIALYAKKSV